ncbi:CPBP family intramembrane glutamic endopeptidase [Undibacterium sp. SXout11W]|uniref:CPBP family intramembrane glutamic endopeptidase n=1 Tax=Undibacterium sp. SXout11W TaxID=3413050 RepID=UPI003BF07587
MLIFSSIFVCRYFLFTQKKSSFENFIPIFELKNWEFPVQIGLLISLLFLITFSIYVNLFDLQIGIHFDFKKISICSIVFVLVSAAMEEALFRGYLLGFFRKLLTRNNSILITSLLFSASHFTYGLDSNEYIYHVLFAILLSLISIKSNSLFPAIFFHATTNYWLGFSMLKMTGLFAHDGIFFFKDKNSVIEYTQFSMLFSILISLIICNINIFSRKH